MGRGRGVHGGAVSVFILNRGRQAQAAWDATGILLRLLNCLWLPACWFVFLPPAWRVCDIFRKATAMCAVLYVEIHISSEIWGILHSRRDQDLSKSPQLYCAVLIVSHLLPYEKPFCFSTPNSTCSSSSLIIFDFQIWLVFHGLTLH